jgi:hypothetical protein
MTELALSMVQQSLRDLDDPNYQPEVMAFIKSDLFAELVKLIGLHETEVEIVRAKALRGDFDHSKLRSIYR